MTDKVRVRALRPTHLVGLRALDARPTCMEITAVTWPRLLAGDSRLPFWSLLSHSMTHPPGYRRIWVHVADDGPDGLLVARVRCGGLVWDVRHLWVDAARETVARDLLLWVCDEAAARGARRVFLETGPDEPALAVARSAGFQHYTWALLYGLRDGPGVSPPAQPGRPRQRGDDHLLFQLYKAAVPAPVRAAEAMTLEEWAALRKDPPRWGAGLLAGWQQFVWDDGGTALAWLELGSAAKSWHAEWLVRPGYEALGEQALAFALEQAKGAPLYATCREYQQPLASALERAGFALVARRAVFARQLAARVREPRLVAARARSPVGG